MRRPRPARPEHDALLFVIIHQGYELWFKELLHEVDRVMRLLDADEWHRAQHTRPRHCTLTLTVAFPPSVNVHAFVSFPPLEQAPDQTASRPFEILSVIAVPVANGAEPVPPTTTRSPAGLDDTDSPLRPLAVTVSVAV